MQIAKATATLAISVFVASLYQVGLLLWTGEIFTWFDLFSNTGRYISFADEPLLAIVQVPFYLVFVLLGGIGIMETFSACNRDRVCVGSSPKYNFGGRN